MSIIWCHSVPVVTLWMILQIYFLIGLFDYFSRGINALVMSKTKSIICTNYFDRFLGTFTLG
jgi:hypothetical protein